MTTPHEHKPDWCPDDVWASTESVAKDRADWLVDAVATSTQNRMFLRGDDAEDEVATESILINGEKAIRIAAARAILADRERRGWQPIETAPKGGEEILVAFGGFDGPCPLVVHWNGWAWVIPDTEITSDVEPTHWQPLPAPPTNGQGD